MNEGGLLGNRRFLVALGLGLALGLGYVLRSVLLPLFLAFLVAYALEPIVARVERLHIPRSVGAPLVMAALVAAGAALLFGAVPLVINEFRDAAHRLPEELSTLHLRVDRLLLDRFHYQMPASFSELFAKYGTVAREHLPDAGKIAGALFGTFSAIFVGLGLLIIPVIALYLLGDFDRIIAQAAALIPRRWAPSVTAIAAEIHTTLGRYVRGQILTNALLATLYALGLSLVGVRLAVPIGVLTGMLGFIPYVGLASGTVLALLMALLDWHGAGQVVGVAVVMASVGTLDAFLITPRIVGGSVGLKPIEVLLTMMAAATLFGFLGVLLAVPIGAVLKILIGHGVDAYLRSRFYREPPAEIEIEAEAALHVVPAEPTLDLEKVEERAAE